MIQRTWGTFTSTDQMISDDKKELLTESCSPEYTQKVTLV